MSYKIVENLTLKEAWDMCRDRGSEELCVRYGERGEWCTWDASESLKMFANSEPRWQVRIPVREYNLLEVMELPVWTRVEVHDAGLLSETIGTVRSGGNCKHLCADGGEGPFVIDDRLTRAKYTIVEEA